MTDTDKIEQGAIIDAKGDFEAINEWLEKIKQDIRDFEIKNPNSIYTGLAIFSLGYFSGLRADRKISWLLQILSGVAFGYSSIQMLGNYFRTREAKKNDKQSGPVTELKHAKIITDDSQKEL